MPNEYFEKYDVQGEVKFASVDLKRVDADGLFEGYASLFGREDQGHDVVLPGAFRDSLRSRRVNGIKMLFQHDPNELIGAWIEIREDAKGLYVKGKLMLEVARAREILSLMRAGVLDGLSIGFRTVIGRRDSKTGVRHLQKIDLWEISVVTFPMLADARISSVKRRLFAGALPTEREFERWLTRDAGLTRSQARTVIGSGFKALTAMQDAAGGAQAGARLVHSLRQAVQIMRISQMRTI
ncbi:hypothetical protein MnTg02_02158 [bacterium MnTg02]|nr:hypothetical protein MnTg02_02158 [bacterium MnTg02]